MYSFPVCAVAPGDVPAMGKRVLFVPHALAGIVWSLCGYGFGLIESERCNCSWP